MIRTYRHAFYAYSIVLVVMLWPIWLNGEVLAPTCHAQINGWQYVTPAMQACEQPKLADFEEEFLPEIANQLTLPHTGFLVTRNEYNELGRPAKHLTGNTPANLFTWIHYQLSNDPYRILTNIAISQWWLLGVFVLLVCQRWGIDARAGWVAAVSAVTTPFVVYWLSFPMHVATLCWGAGLVYACTRVVHRPDGWGWLIAAFCTYSMVLMGYPQTAVYTVWMLAGYVVWVCVPLWRQRDWHALGLRVGVLLSAGLVGVVLCTPVLWDAYQRYRESQRYWIGDDFFMQAVQYINAWDGVWLYTTLRLAPEMFGNPSAAQYPLEYDGASWPLITVGMVALAGRLRWQQSRYWIVVTALLVMLTVVPFVFAWVTHVIPGFRLSAWTPLWSAVLPIAYTVAWGTDALVRQPPHVRRRVMAVAGVVMAGIVVLGIGLAWYLALALDPWRVTALVLMLVMWAVWWWRISDVALVVGLGIVVVTTALPLVRVQPETALIRRTPLIDLLRRELTNGSRYAIVSGRLGHLLSPNYNALLGLASVHAYNNFYPPAYANLVTQLGGKITVYGKLNKFVSPDPQSTAFWMSNIAVVLHDQPIDGANLLPLTIIDGIHVYRTSATMGSAWRIDATVLPGVDDIRISDYRVHQARPWQLVVDAGDVVEYAVAPRDQPSLLVRSTLYERGWRAEVRHADGTWHTTRTLSVNSVFLGAPIPANVTGIRFVYQTVVQWMWASHLLWLVLALGVWVRERVVQRPQVAHPTTRHNTHA